MLDQHHTTLGKAGNMQLTDNKENQESHDKEDNHAQIPQSITGGVGP